MFTAPRRDARLLMIDDDEDTFVLTQAMLGQVQRLTYSLDWQATPEEGLMALMSGAYDACLLDVHLGPTSGLELLDRAVERGCPTPIIVMTGSFGRVRSDAAIVRAGASDFLSKHRLTPEALDRSVRYAIERQQLAASLQAERRELAQSEERLRELIRHLTSDVSHELNNLLTVVMSNAQLLRDVVPAASLDDLDALVEAAARAGVIIENLRYAGAAPIPTTDTGAPPAWPNLPRERAPYCILLVEDEQEIRRTARRILERAGYRVLDARNGREALLKLDQPDAGVDLILSDIVMPEMGGRELASRLKDRETAPPIVFMTGYDPADDGMPDDMPVLRKPWTLDELLEHIRRALSQQSQ